MTLLPRAGVPRPIVVEGRTLLEPESSVVWFTFPGAWHDIGRFHTAEGALTAIYANVLTPVHIAGDEWRTTDLFLDVLLEPGGEPRVLDSDQLQGALERGWLDDATARRAQAEAERLMAAARDGHWPPPIVDEWTLERARQAAAGHPSSASGVSPATEGSKSEE